MTTLALQYDILNGQPGDALPVESNFNLIQQHVNTELIERDGSVAMRQPLRLSGDPVAALDAAPKQYVDAFFPLGGVIMYGGAAAPAGGKWLLCDGAEYAQATYPALFAVIAQTYGGAAGTFRVPDLRSRFPIGTSGSFGMGAQGGTADAVVVTHDHTMNHDHPAGNTGTVSADHTHTYSGNTSGQSNQHQHFGPGGVASLLSSVDSGQGIYVGVTGGGIGPLYNAFTGNYGADHSHAFSGTTSGISANHSHSFDVANFTGSTAATGVSATNANLPPYLVVNFLMRAL